MQSQDKVSWGWNSTFVPVSIQFYLQCECAWHFCVKNTWENVLSTPLPMDSDYDDDDECIESLDRLNDTFSFCILVVDSMINI